MLERTAGLEPASPYRKYGALQSCVRKNYRVGSAAFARMCFCTQYYREQEGVRRGRS
jgi:hypothetical protein